MIEPMTTKFDAITKIEEELVEAVERGLDIGFDLDGESDKIKDELRSKHKLQL